MRQFKLVLLGESTVGKSSLVLRFVKRTFQEYQETTIGAAFVTHSVEVDGVTVKFEIWDTAGQDRFHALAPMYYRNAQAAVVVYAVTQMETFAKAKQWVKELQRQSDPTVITLAGNKVDLVAAPNQRKRQVPEEEARIYAEEEKLLLFETSAKTDANVAPMFAAIAKKLLLANDAPSGSKPGGVPVQAAKGGGCAC